METKEKITQTLQKVSSDLKEIAPDFCIIGTSATLLSGLDVGNTSDIDILTTLENSDKLKSLWSDFLEEEPVTKENDLFISDFARYKFPLIDIEVMGELKIKKEGIWQPVTIYAHQLIEIGDVAIPIPTIREQLRILHLFGREKDLKRIELINRLL